MEKSEFYSRARRDLRGPLDGVRVLEVTTTWAGPMCGCLFADMGADVIKAELPGGEVARRLPPVLPGTREPLSFMHATLNRNKRSLTLDLRLEEGRDICLRLAARVDVLVENFRPGTMHGWGVGYDHVRAVKPDIVYVSISGYGQFGPDSSRPAYDPIAQAASGFASLNGEVDGRPLKAPTFIGDDLAGLHGAIGALAALRHRDASGEGQHVDVSLLDSLLFQSNGYLTLAAMGAPVPRLGSQFQVAAPADIYPCRDGHVIAGVLLDSHWERLTRVIGRPELADHPDWATARARVGRRDEANALLADWLRELTVEEAMAALASAGLAAERVRSYAEAAEDVHVQARDMLQATPQEDGSVAPIVGPAAKFSRTPTRVRTGAPALGADSDEILSELGLDAQAILRLREQGVS